MLGILFRPDPFASCKLDRATPTDVDVSEIVGRLLRLTRKTRQKVFLVVDGHPVHKARSVTRWLDEHREQIRVFFLPSYSPELNPDELLKQDVKSNALGRVRSVNIQEMMDNVRSYLRITQARPTVVKNYFCERHVRYAAG